MKQTFLTVEAYIESFPENVQLILNELRKLIKKNAPDAVERIAYQMPAYQLHKKPLVYFAAYKHHIGFYATPIAHSEFSEALSRYKQGKGSVQFPLDEPMPYDLIERMVNFRVAENLDNKQ